MNFHEFADVVNKKLESMQSQDLFRTNIPKDDIWEVYISSYPAGSNELYIERTEHDCQTCRQFIKAIGNCVAINPDGTLESIWDIEGLEHPYDVVAETLSVSVKNAGISPIFLHNEPKAGKQSSVQLKEDGSTITWNHFYGSIPTKFYERDIATQYSKANSRAAVHLRSLNEIPMDVLLTVQDLINSDTIYRGAEHASKLNSFIGMKSKFITLEENQNYAWATFRKPGAGIRSSVIGSLLVDLSKGEDLESAVKSFEAKVAPSNYKRPKKLITQAMINKAIKEIDNLGIRDSLPRRQAMPTDVSVNDIIFADRSVGLADKDPLAALLEPAVKPSGDIKGLANAPEISIEDFLSDVVPSANSIELITSNKHSSNKVQISAPVNADAPNILQWDNNFSWSYAGNVADSEMKERVKAAGGKVDGVLRMSLQWNEEGKDGSNDLDAYCNTPKGNIYYGNRKRAGGELDVDITNPSGQCPNGTAVENITWAATPVDGAYTYKIVNFSGQNTKGFRAEVEFDGELYNYDYSTSVTSDVNVATVTLKNGQFSIQHHLPHSKTTNQQFVPVKMIMLSPNHWEENESGNKHFMFLTDEEQDTAPFRGFYNEFISPKLHEHRKVFDMLSSKMMREPAEGGLSGLGFSSTKRTEVHAKVDNKLYNIKF